MFVIDFKSINLTLFNKNLDEYLNIDFGYLKQNSKLVFSQIFILLKLSAVAILFSYILSLFISFIGNNLFNKRYMTLIIKIVLLFARIISGVILFILLNLLYKNKEVPILLVMIFTTTRAMSKFFIESINGVNKNIVANNLTTKLKNKYSLFILYILPNIHQELVSYAFYRFENIYRNLVTYGSLTTVGIGFLYKTLTDTKIGFNQGEVSAIAFIIMISIIIIEISNLIYKMFILNKYLNKNIII
ncbi:UNVERIFIED_CONTAM: hypothetical protein O8I53_13560 [Campylobacter lari]